MHSVTQKKWREEVPALLSDSFGEELLYKINHIFNAVWTTMATTFAATFEGTTNKRASKSNTLRQLTHNDSKILGSKVTRKLEKTVPAKKFQTRSFKTLNSAYTPIVHKPSNEQVRLYWQVNL